MKDAILWAMRMRYWYSMAYSKMDIPPMSNVRIAQNWAATMVVFAIEDARREDRFLNDVLYFIP